MRLKHSIAWLATVAALGCQDANQQRFAQTDATELANISRENLLRVLRGCLETSRFLTESNTLAQLLRSSGATQTPQEVFETAQTKLGDLDRALRDQILTPENRDKADSEAEALAGGFVFHLPLEQVCDPEENESELETEEASDKPRYGSCAERFDAYQPRLLLKEHASSDVELEVQLGPEHLSVAHVELLHNEVVAVLSLDALFEVLGALEDDLSPISEMNGSIRLSLARVAERRYRLGFEIPDELRFVLSLHGSLITAKAPANSQELSIDLDAPSATTGSLQASFAMGASELTGALNAFQDLFPVKQSEGDEPKVYTGTVELSVPPLNSRISYESDEDELRIRNLGLIDSSLLLAFEGTPIVKFDLGASDKPAISARLSPRADNLVLAFDSTPEATLLTDFRELSRQIEDLPASLLNNVFHLWAAAEEPLELELAEENIKVTRGSLHLDSAETPASNQTANVDQCFTFGEPSSTAPSSTAPSSTAPSSTAPSNTAPSNTAPSNTAPSNTAPSNTAPSNTAPSNTAPSNTAPSNTAPSNTAPSNTAPSSTDATAPDPAAAMPDSAGTPEPLSLETPWGRVQVVQCHE